MWKHCVKGGTLLVWKAMISSISRAGRCKYLPQYIHTALLASKITLCFTSAAQGECVLGEKLNLLACVPHGVVWLRGHAGDEEAEMWLQPSNSHKASEWLQDSLKKMFRNTVWFSREEEEEEEISRGVGRSCRRRGAFPQLRLMRMGIGLLGPSWQLFCQRKLKCNSLFLVLSWPQFTSYLLVFTIQKGKRIVCLFVWFHVIKDGCGKADWGHVIKWYGGIRQENKPKIPKLSPSGIIKEVVKQRRKGLLVSVRTAERAG